MSTCVKINSFEHLQPHLNTAADYEYVGINLGPKDTIQDLKKWYDEEIKNKTNVKFVHICIEENDELDSASVEHVVKIRDANAYSRTAFEIAEYIGKAQKSVVGVVHHKYLVGSIREYERDYVATNLRRFKNTSIMIENSKSTVKIDNKYSIHDIDVYFEFIARLRNALPAYADRISVFFNYSNFLQDSKIFSLLNELGYEVTSQSIFGLLEKYDAFISVIYYNTVDGLSTTHVPFLSSVYRKTLVKNELTERRSNIRISADLDVTLDSCKTKVLDISVDIHNKEYATMLKLKEYDNSKILVINDKEYTVLNTLVTSSGSVLLIVDKQLILDLFN